MSLFDWAEYLSLNASAAVAIAVDACVLVLLKFRDLSSLRSVLKWAGAIGLTHALLPLVGFIGGWAVIARWNLVAPVYGVGAILLACLIFFVIRESIASNHLQKDQPSFLTIPRNRIAGVMAFWIPILYVSMDALLSGPGKTVLLDRYPAELAWLSFGIVGGLVALFTLGSGVVSRAMHVYWLRGRVTSFSGLAKAITWAIIAELTLFSFFLSWCIAKLVESVPMGASYQIPLNLIVIVGLSSGAIVTAALFHRIYRAKLAEAQMSRLQ